MEARTTDILDRLPHRPPFRFVTDALELDGNDEARAIWRVTGDESMLEGHFPGAPMVPGVLIGEALAQLSGLIVAAREPEVDRAAPARAGKLAHMNLRFPATVVPPADIALKSKLERVFGSLWQFEAEASWKGTTVARGSLALAMSEETA